MDFGKLANISKVDFTLPTDHPNTSRILGKGNISAKLEMFSGCPVWANKTWAGTWYPNNIKEKDFLKYYSRQFNTIELNTTHYRIPDDATLARWFEDAQEGFRFCPKILQEISHHKIMDGTFHKFTEFFCHQILKLKEKLGISFLQLPPYFEPKHTELLIRFLDFFPDDIPLAIEFRNEKWFQNESYDSITAYMEENNIHHNLTDVAGRRDVLHMRLTSPVLFLRFVGNSLDTTDFQRVDDWITRLVEWKNQGLERIYFFAHEPDNQLSPELSNYFIKQANQYLGLEVKPAVSYQQNIQGKLF